MDEAELFVRDAMSFSSVTFHGRKSPFPGSRRLMATLSKLLGRFRQQDGSGDPYAYVGAPVKPKPPRLQSAVRLPLPQ